MFSEDWRARRDLNSRSSDRQSDVLNQTAPRAHIESLLKNYYFCFNINVNSIAPGFTHSAGGDKFDQNRTMTDVPLEDVQKPMRSLKRSTYPEDLVGTALFLASEESRNITGQLIVVDCGLVFH